MSRAGLLLCMIVLVWPASAGAARTPYMVGAAKRTITPRPQDGEVHLGGYGLGPERTSAGTFPGGVRARAVAITGGGHTLVLADVELQGWFIADGADALGINDVRRAVAARSGGLLTPTDVIVQSDHTHSGPDLLGAWGGVSEAYRQRVFDKTVGVILAAVRNRRPADLSYGTAGAHDLLTNQFAYDPPNQSLDDELRVLVARNRRGKRLVTVLNFSAHATVLGGDNRLASGDWTTRANELMEHRFGGKAVTIMGTLGRTQPDDRACSDDTDVCRVDAYAKRVVRRTRQAVRSATPLRGPARIDARSYLIEDLSTAPAVLGLNYAGGALGAQLVRATTPPWLAVNVLGTTTTTARIGDVLLMGVPGEAYPQIPLAIRNIIPGLRGYMTMGLANDQLGYLIAPADAFAEPIRRTLFNERGDQISPIDNDNYFFNVSFTIGDRVTCSLLRGAGELLQTGTAPRDAYAPCSAFADDLTRPAGADVP